MTVTVHIVCHGAHFVKQASFYFILFIFLYTVYCLSALVQIPVGFYADHDNNLN